MPQPLTPSSSQEIIAISPPPPPRASSSTKRQSGQTRAFDLKPQLASTSKTLSHMSNYASTSTSSSSAHASLSTGHTSSGALASASTTTTLPTPHTFHPSPELKTKIAQHVRADKYLQQIGEVPTPGDPRGRGGQGSSSSAAVKTEGSTAGTSTRQDRGTKRKARQDETNKERTRLDELGMGRERVTQRMMSTLGKGSNPITNSDLYTRTDHFVSSATGHQQSNAGGGSAGMGTYWEVRNAKMLEQAREKKTSILSGCVFYINGSTGPRVSNLQLQNIITSNGGRFVPMQNGSCTHIIANGGLSGTKTQKWIDGQGGRGLAKRMKVVKVDWILDSIEKGKRVSEAGYGVIEDPSQSSLLKAFGAKSKAERTEDTQPRPETAEHPKLTICHTYHNQH